MVSSKGESLRYPKGLCKDDDIIAEQLLGTRKLAKLGCCQEILPIILITVCMLQPREIATGISINEGCKSIDYRADKCQVS